MSNKYIYHGEPEERGSGGPLPPGDFSFTVADCSEPYQKNDKWILPVKITIQPQGTPVFANPWTGTTRDGEDRDGIAEFLLAVNRAPAGGQEPDWRKVIGARGKCRLKVEVATLGALAGKEVNKVAFFHRPKQIGPQSQRDYSQAEVNEAREVAERKAGKPDSRGISGHEPDDIPFAAW